MPDDPLVFWGKLDNGGSFGMKTPDVLPFLAKVAVGSMYSVFFFEIKIFSLGSDSCNFPTPLDIQSIGGGAPTYTSEWLLQKNLPEHVLRCVKDETDGIYCI